MEINDGNIKPQQTGGLKLMTVFIAVLALHVVVIGGFSAYYLLKGGSADSDLVTDKTHKGAKTDTTMASDGQMPDTAQADKNTTASTTTPDAVSGPINIPAPSADSTASTDSNTTPTTTSPTASAPVVPTPAPAPRGPVITPPSAPASPAVVSTPAITPDVQPPVTINGAPYVVKSGDSLARIAHQNHTSVAKLKAANSLTNDMLHIGQKMVIPARTQIVAAPVANTSGNTTILSESPATPPMNVPAPAVTPVTGAAPDQIAPTTAAHGRTYTVVKGDTLTKIARKFKTTPTAIMTANNLTDATKLSIGKKLKIPSQESRSATNSEPAPQPQPQPAETQPKADTTAQLANFIQ